jgi:hypothetical protein
MVVLVLGVALVVGVKLGTKGGGPQGDVVDEKALPRDGPGDPALTYAEVSKIIAKYRGKRVTWAFVPCSSENNTMLCSLDVPAARRSGADGMYLVRFGTEQEMRPLFLEAGFSSGATITGTVAEEVETGVTSRDRFGAILENIPKARLPLLLYPVYKPPGGAPR